MADVFTKQKRSEVMAAIKGKGNKSTEQTIKSLLRKHGLCGWRSQAHGVIGKPDIVFRRQQLAIFADGCFWHGCRKCGSRDRIATNKEFWRQKIQGNIGRDRRVSRELKSRGWRVLRLWEHDIEKNPERCLGRIRKIIVGVAAEGTKSAVQPSQV